MAYIPKFETQRDENAPLPWTNCNPASAAMLIDLWTWGALNTSDVILRRASPVPLGYGMNFRQVGAAISKLYPQLGQLMYSERDESGNAQRSWAWLRTHLRGGGGAVVCGMYSSLAHHRSSGGLQLTRWQPGGNFGHAMFVCDGTDNDLLLMDPLGHGNYTGDRISWLALWDFIWRVGNGPDAVVTAAHSFSVRRPNKPVPSTGYAGKPTVFGTTYPPYVQTDREALRWVERRIEGSVPSIVQLWKSGQIKLG